MFILLLLLLFICFLLKAFNEVGVNSWLCFPKDPAKCTCPFCTIVSSQLLKLSLRQFDDFSLYLSFLYNGLKSAVETPYVSLMTFHCTCLSCTMISSLSVETLPYVSLIACHCTCLSCKMVSSLSVEILLYGSLMTFIELILPAQLYQVLPISLRVFSVQKSSIVPDYSRTVRNLPFLNVLTLPVHRQVFPLAVKIF